jgi:hypothetical protein
LVNQLPSDIPLVLQRDKAKSLAEAAIDAPVTLNLRTPLGTELAATMDGTPIIKKFRALTESSADLFDSQIIMGLAQGQTISQIQKRLVGNISYVGDRTFLGKGAQLEAKNAQVRTLVRTSVMSVNNTAAQSVYQANQHVTKKYKFVATLDSRTCLVCMDKDQKVYNYGDGPVPPLHFSDRCITLAQISYDELGISPPEGSTRASADGQVPASLNYEEWLKKQPKGDVEKILGKGKADLFLSNKIAIADIVRTDTSEVSLAQLQKSVESGQLEKDRIARERKAEAERLATEKTAKAKALAIQKAAEKEAQAVAEAIKTKTEKDAKAAKGINPIDDYPPLNMKKPRAFERDFDVKGTSDTVQIAGTPRTLGQLAQPSGSYPNGYYEGGADKIAKIANLHVVDVEFGINDSYDFDFFVT